MSGHAPVDPAEVPVFTGDLGELDKQVKAISSGGATVSTKASDVHTSFGGLQAFYQAPEADQLFATTKPVQDLGLKLSSDMCTIAGALGTYARDAEPLVNRLNTLKIEAESFRSRVSDDEKWFEDGDLIDQNLERRNAIAEVWAHFQDVESACYAKIAALVGKPGLKKDDGSHGEGMYGYDAEALKQSKSLPWGDAVEESVPAWQIWEHAWDFGTGFIVDGIGGTLAGLGGLVGLDGWDTFKASWTGLAKLSTATAITSIPGVGPLFFAVPDDKMPSWLRESRTAMKETGKALLAWDQWGSNPSRAAGAVTFNVVTTVCTGGTGGAVSGAGKAGAIAKALSFAGKAGRAVDPMTYVFKGAGAGVSKIGDVMAGLRGMGKFETPKINVDGATALPEGTLHLPDGSIHLPAGSAVPDGAIKLPDGNIKLPEGTTTLPPGTVKLPVDGPPKFMDPNYNIYNHKGEIIQHAEDVPKGKPAAGSDIPRVDAPKVDSPATAKIPERELAGAVARGGDGIRLGSDISDPVHAADHTPNHTPGGTAPHGPTNNLDNTPPTAGHGPGGSHPDTPSTATHVEGPSGSGHADGPSSGDGGHHEGPSTGGGHGETGPGAPGSGGHGPGDGPGGGSEMPDREPPVILEGDRISQQPSGKMPAEQEAAVTGALSEARVPSVDQARMLTQLKKSEYGAAVADYIASGRFADIPNYKELIFQVKQSDMMPAVHQAMDHAAELQAKGISGIEFEVKIPSEKLDLDVLTRVDGKIEYGAQLKDVQSANGIKSAVKKIAEKQLAGSGVDVKAAILDVNDFKGAVTERDLQAVQRAADRTNATFELRFNDGSITVFPTNSVRP
ncbi:hypothetical protein [Streptomyces sp. NRRL S-244]|uniref:hypothetical protein n=1 Tax=Streptomyces sp. NRRL S-244 TaxID=1463897 RepID=UPI0004C239AE|nr:hypothetical protein [Streptomyces sp. NRRL S-244]